MDETLRSKLDELVKTNPVVLFMKGTPSAPQCGFSAQVVKILGELVEPGYASVNVLAEPEVRDAIKEYSDWPTIPQLYVNGEFVGGCDIVRDMYQKGELQKVLGVQAAEVKAPEVTVTDSARDALLAAQKEAGNEPLHLAVSDNFASSLDVGPREPHEIEVVANGVTFYVDRGTAKRANGLKIDFVDTNGQKGFKIENPNAPPRVKQVSVKELKALLDAGRPIQLFDVRGPDEAKTASIKGARLLDDAALSDLARMSKDTPIYFHCHHGGRSQRAAEQFLGQGFKNVHNIVGGIDKWSTEIDSSVPRY
jgi:monothiol glutaredoxin